MFFIIYTPNNFNGSSSHKNSLNAQANKLMDADFDTDIDLHPGIRTAFVVLKR